MCPLLVSFTCCLHLFTQKHTYLIESNVSALQLLTLDSSLDLIWATQQHFVRFQQVLAWKAQRLVWWNLSCWETLCIIWSIRGTLSVQISYLFLVITHHPLVWSSWFLDHCAVCLEGHWLLHPIVDPWLWSLTMPTIYFLPTSTHISTSCPPISLILVLTNSSQPHLAIQTIIRTFPLSPSLYSLSSCPLSILIILAVMYQGHQFMPKEGV